MGRKRKNNDTTVARTTHPPPAVPHARVVSMHTTATGRVGQSTSFVPFNPVPTHDPDDSADFTDFLDVSSIADEMTGGTSGEDASMGVEAYTPLQDWASNHRQTYLDEMMRHDGLAGVHTCAKCHQDGVYKCKECFGFQLLCQDCFVERHVHLPLHRALVRCWLQCDGVFFLTFFEALDWGSF